MPLLPREPDLFPDDLFSLPDEEFPWGVAPLRRRQEKVLARFLLQNGVPFYLPQIEQVTKRGGRTYKSHLPLLTGYVFFRLAPTGRDLLWRSNVVAALLDVPDQVQLGSELAQLRALQLAGASLRPEPELAAGDPVRITGGAFAGYTGVVMRERGQARLIVQISLIRQAVAVEFGRDVLAPAR